MFFNHLLTFFQHLQSLITHLIIIPIGTIIFVYYLIFDKNQQLLQQEKSNVNEPESNQLVVYTGTTRNFKINVTGGSIQFSTWSQRLDIKGIRMLNDVTIEPRILINNTILGPSNRFTFLPLEKEKNTQKRIPKSIPMLMSLQENLLIQRMNAFANKE
ncbi:hypothetical protein B9Z55_001484 [Caenorhabditis nigoni]|uniref:Uncharacterized protein n=1 Tax=Caenorhabditis nigoni TaxID=1611254 RepID=A0A2G5VGA7_9PELO|nr:hypothetical protein B9Z55_001484 [Caenorhabditis nigoni]